MESEGESTSRPRRRRLPILLAGAVSVVLAFAVLVGVPPRSGGKLGPSAAIVPGAPASPAAAAATPVPDPLPPPAASSVAPTPATIAPVRAPQIVASGRPTAATPAVPALVAGLERALGGTAGCLVVEDDGVTTFERNPTSALVPASSQKLLVAAAALSRLGPGFRFETKVVAAHTPRDGTLGDAWFVGAGDPFLATPDYAAYLATRPRSRDLPVTPLAALADELVGRGVRAIPGGLRPDESRYDTQRSVPSWKPSYVAEAEVGSLGALTVNEGLAGWGPSQAVAPDPAASAAVALSDLLTQRGVALPAPSAAGPAPAGAVVVASVRSAPLADIVGAMLRASDNFAAELLLREVDRQTGGTGSTAGGAARVVDEAARLGLSTEGVHLVDGSGLDLGNRATCRSLLGALDLSRQSRFAVLDTGLAVAGRSGTLVKRFVGSPVEGRLAAKTGWISGVAAMVGRLDGHPTRRFALIVNGTFNWPAAQALEDRVVDVLATAPG